MHPRRAAPPREAIQLLALAGFNAGISHRCVEPMLPELAREFGTSVSAASVVMTTYAFAYAASLLILGPLGDKLGKLRVVTVGMALAGLASLGCAAAWDVGSLAAMRLATGLFASASVALGMAYIGDVVPIEERQTTIAHFIAGSILGQAVGPLVGGAFTDWVGWRASFVLLGAIFVAVSAILYGRTAAGWAAPAAARLRPFTVYRDLWSLAPMRWLLAVSLVETFFFFGAYAFLGAFLRLRFELSFTVIGLILAGFGVGGLLYSSSARVLVRRLGERGLTLGGGLLGGAMLAAIVWAPHPGLIAGCTVALGFAFYLVHNTVQTRATEVAPHARGSAVALYATGWALGQALGIAAIGLAVAAVGYAPAILACGLAFAALGAWLRGNLYRLKP
ncbi:MAG TPA: MFS transporter [Burkholderiales bacterium]|nr:MFS transporter [Burkholderiales bacterium]